MTAKSKKKATPASGVRRRTAKKPTRPKKPTKPTKPKKTARARRAAPDARRRRAPRATRATRVVTIIDNEDPISALRRFLGTIRTRATVSQGQIALGSAQLMLLPMARDASSGAKARDLVDLVLARWDAFPDRAGFHAQEFLRNAVAAIGDDRPRLARLAAIVPTDASGELHHAVAAAHAVAGDRAGMLAAAERALAAGIAPHQLRRDADFAAFVDDADLAALLARAAEPTPIPVDVDPHVAPVRAALDRAVDTITGFGEPIALGPPTSLDRVLAIESARRVALPNEFRALLTLHDGLRLWDVSFFGTADLRGDTPLAHAARAFLEHSADYGAAGIDQCVPLANWGQPNNWLLYDPRGAFRGGEPGYVILLAADEWPQDSLVAALEQLAATARDVLGGTTN